MNCSSLRNTGAHSFWEVVAGALVDIYMPDFKFWDAEMARRYIRAAKLSRGRTPRD
jgi:uncharacterized Fe-S radical SAM superfamily protein PflX